MRVGILSDFPSPAVQSGPAIHTRFLAQGLSDRGHEVVLMGPNTQREAPVRGEHHLYTAVPYPTHQRVRLALPGPVKNLTAPPRVDVVHGQTATHMAEYANWMRRMHQTAVLNTNTVNLPTHSHFMMSDGLYANPAVRRWFRATAENLELEFARLYNDGDALIVQSRYFRSYWRDRGVTVPIHVVGRPIDPARFSKPAGGDPYPESFRPGSRLVVVCRHDREKSLDVLIDLFDSHIAPADPHVTLTLVGDGHDHANLMRCAGQKVHADRIHFSGEIQHARLVDWYTHGDVFVYTSLSETFGNVINEALWCGLPVVAMDDRMGVAHQVAPGLNGFLIQPDRDDTAGAFAEAALQLCQRRDMRRTMGEKAATLARATSHPDNVMRHFERIYDEAIAHAKDHVRRPLSTRSKVAQLSSLAKYCASWGRFNGAALALAYGGTLLGQSRTGGASQHEAALRERAAREAAETELPRGRRAL